MKKDYVVEYQLSCTVVVCGAESEDEAFEFAESEASFGDCEMIEGKARQVTDKRALESEIRHANAVSRADG